jgi:hypothetical protein
VVDVCKVLCNKLVQMNEALATTECMSLSPTSILRMSHQLLHAPSSFPINASYAAAHPSSLFHMSHKLWYIQISAHHIILRPEVVVTDVSWKGVMRELEFYCFRV